MNVLFRFVRLRPGKDVRELSFDGLERRLNRDDLVADAKILREDFGIGEAAAARIARGHGNAHDFVRAQRVHGQHRREGRVNAAGQTQHHRLETALVNVVPDAERKRAEKLFLLRRPVRFCGRSLAVHFHDEDFFGETLAER